MSIKLNGAALSSLPAEVSVPGYDRSAITPGILHIGVGNFHRAHQARYLDRLFELGCDQDWGLIGAGVTDYDAAMRTSLAQQDWLSTLVELDAQGLSARVSGAMIDFIEINPERLINALIDPQIRIVSLTITEGGYFTEDHSGDFQLDHPDIQKDIANMDAPKTVFGILLAALSRRRELGLAGFTLLSCDNLPENGLVTRRALLGLAQAINPELATWIETQVAFPNSVVDCITPTSSDQSRARVTELFGIEDAAPVLCEPYRQWLIEDQFPQGRPALEKVGVDFVADVRPYELMKLRILNGGHCALAFAAALLGYHFVHQAMADPLIRSFLRKVLIDDIVPIVPGAEGVEPLAYCALIEQRFANPEVEDRVQRLCVDTSNRLPKFILPSILDNLAIDRSTPGLALVVALWWNYCLEACDTSSQMELVDEWAELLKARARRATDTPEVFLDIDSIFGSLGQSAEFKNEFCNAVRALQILGVRAALEQYTDSNSRLR